MNIILYFVEQDRFLFLFLLIKNYSNMYNFVIICHNYVKFLLPWPKVE